ncbi:MAG TPA: DUF4864 domain-containing protein [Microvirga sp.]
MRAWLVLVAALLMAAPAQAAPEAPIRQVIEDQLQAFKSDDAARAYGHAAPGIRRAFPSEDRFMALVREMYKPVYRQRSYRFGELKDTPEGPMQAVDIQDADGVDWTAVYLLEQQPDGSWKIAGCTLLKKPGQTV